jgi:muramoyltetrapeptide carboxypeptidase LdcA involved in peptidoglycan recycling
MEHFKKLLKLQKGDKVAILSPSFAAPAVWPHVYQLGLERLKNVFGLVPVEYPSTKKLGASGEERSRDLIEAFSNPEIKAVISTLGGDDEVTYIKNLPSEPFINNPKPFFGYSDTTHFQHFLWMNKIPSFYGGNLFTQFAMQGEMDEFSKTYLELALFEDNVVELTSSKTFNEESLSWDNLENLNQKRKYEINHGWIWDGVKNTRGILWGGCLESVDELLRHNIQIPSLDDFKNLVLILETSEEIPSKDYVNRVVRAFGERGLLENIQGVLVGRPKAWEFDNQKNTQEKEIYKKEQAETILKAIRRYNPDCPIIQNMDFGHTDPQICMPLGREISINSETKSLTTSF